MTIRPSLQVCQQGSLDLSCSFFRAVAVDHYSICERDVRPLLQLPVERRGQEPPDIGYVCVGVRTTRPPLSIFFKRHWQLVLSPCLNLHQKPHPLSQSASSTVAFSLIHFCIHFCIQPHPLSLIRFCIQPSPLLHPCLHSVSSIYSSQSIITTSAQTTESISTHQLSNIKYNSKSQSAIILCSCRLKFRMILTDFLDRYFSSWTENVHHVK